MGKTTIHVSCIDQRLAIISPPAIASGGKNEDMVEFEFCPLWAGFAKTAVFYRHKSDPYHAIVTDDKCIIPWEVLQTDGFVYFGVFGVKGDITRTSEVIRYRVTAGAITEGTKPSDPTPDIYEQLLGKMSNVESLVAPSDPYSLTGKLVQLDNFEGMPMNAVTRIEPVQAGSGNPSPSNVRPITGHTGAKLTRCGKNLLPPVFTSKTNNGVTYTVNSDGTVTANGTATAASIAMFADFMLPAGDYILSGGGTVWVGLQITDANGANSYIASVPEFQQQKFTLTGTETGIRSYFRVNTGITVNNLTAYPMIRFASDPDSTYEPYQGETFSASFGQTVYGGTLDWNTGVLTVEWKKVSGKMTRSTTDSSGKLYMISGVPYSVKQQLNGYAEDDPYVICSALPYKALEYARTSTEPCISQYAASVFVGGYIGQEAELDAILASDDFQIAYKLATPTTIQLTPAQLTALQGMNNIFCDAGETTVSGRKDILWLTSGLLQRIQTLESTIATLEAAALSE